VGGRRRRQGRGRGDGRRRGWISGAAILEFGAASDAAVSFDAGASGTLKLDLSASFAGSIAGFAAGDSLDLADIGFAANTTLGFSENSAGTGGTLTVSDGTHTANLALFGQYSAASFASVGDQNGGALVTYAGATNLTEPLTLTKPVA
jgi:hypothetical protein